MYKARITTALLNASLLINKVLKGDCTFQEFVNEYGNFFYYEALDGHEANQQEQEVLSQPAIEAAISRDESLESISSILKRYKEKGIDQPSVIDLLESMRTDADEKDEDRVRLSFEM